MIIALFITIGISFCIYYWFIKSRKRKPSVIICSLIFLSSVAAGIVISSFVSKNSIGDYNQLLFLIAVMGITACGYYLLKPSSKKDTRIAAGIVIIIFGCGLFGINQTLDAEKEKQLKQYEEERDNLFSNANGLYSHGDFRETKKSLELYIQKYPNGPQIKEVNEMLSGIDAKILEQEKMEQIEKEKIRKLEEEKKAAEELAKRPIADVAREALGINSGKRLMDVQYVEIIDNKPGKNFITMAVYMDKPNKNKFIVFADDFKKQSSGWRYIIYFVKDKSYTIDRRVELEEKVLAVYASTTRKLQIFDADNPKNPNPIETLML